MMSSHPRIVFLNYGLFNSNSGGHIINFASALASAGYSVCVCAEGDPNAVDFDYHPDVEFRAHETIDLEPDVILRPGLDGEAPILHAWTPREKVIDMATTLAAHSPVRLFVHLEDNEEVLASAALGLRLSDFRELSPSKIPDPFPKSLSHPDRYREFLKSALGVTAIVERLKEFVPGGVPTHVLEPGVDVERYSSPLDPQRRQLLRDELGITTDESVCVYHGNMHAANQREIFSLCTAILILARRRRKVRLIRTGKDFTDGLDISSKYLRSAQITELGFVPRSRLIEILKCADFFVQPGASNKFNDYRFPSKLPEFLAVGRPVVLPATNVGLRIRDGVEALLLTRGDGSEIADKVEELISNPALSERLGQGGRDFAARELNWARNAEKLITFYQTCLTAWAESGPDRL